MFRAIKKLFIFILLSFAIIIISGMITSATTNNANTFAIIVFPSLFVLTFYFISKEIKYNRSFHQQTLSKQPSKTQKPLKKAPNQSTLINKEIVIDYNDSKGEITSRKIRIKEIKYNKQKRKTVPYSLYAYCFLKKAPRTFLISNIISAYDADTGEIINDIPSYLMK